MPAAFSISASLSVMPRMVSRMPHIKNTPPMIRRRSKRLAARSTRSVSGSDISVLPYHKTTVRTVAPSSTKAPRILGALDTFTDSSVFAMP